MNELLEQQASAIEAFLAHAGVEARIEGGTLSPRLISYNLSLGPGVRSGRVAALTSQLAAALAVGSVRLARHGDSLALEVPRADPSTVRLLPLYQQLSIEDSDEGAVPTATALLGLDYEGTPLLLRLVSPEVANLLIMGQAGSGKSSVMSAMIACLALANGPDEVQIMLLDVGGRKKRTSVFAAWDGLPHLICPPISDQVEANHRLAWLARQMEWRTEEGTETPTILVFIDELPDLLAGADENLERLLLRLIARGRTGGIHFVCGASQPSAIKPLLTETNFPARLIGRLASAEEAEALTGARASQAERLLGRGDFLISLHGEMTRLQTASVNDKEIAQLVGLMAQIAAERAEEEARKRPGATRRGNLTSIPVQERSGRNWQTGGGGGMGAASPLPAAPAPRSKGILDSFRRKN